MEMAVKKKKVRLNLYLRKDVVDFAKNWSYVTDTPISKMLEEYLRGKQELIPRISPFQWLSDPDINPELLEENEFVQDMEEYIMDEEEEEFCLENPDHPRARVRRKLKEEYSRKIQNQKDNRRKREQDVIQRWMEVFSVE